MRLALPEGEVEVVVRRSKQARRMILRVASRDGTVKLTLPARARLSDARSFLEAHQGWVAARLAKVAVAVPFAAGAVVPLRGLEHRIVHHPGDRRAAWIETGETPLICIGGRDPAGVARRVRALLMNEALADLTAASQRHADTLGVTIGAISLRDPAARWGSCSTTGELMYSWRIVLAPPVVLDYLAAHEVAHRRHMNHSPAFWRTVRELHPHMDEAKAWLRRHGHALHRYGKSA